MALNYIWIVFFLIGFVVALGQLVFGGNARIFNEMVNAVFFASMGIDMQFSGVLPVSYSHNLIL